MLLPPAALRFVVPLLLAGCSFVGTEDRFARPQGDVLPKPQTRTSAGSYIKHVVVIVQENRSFDNVFAGFPGADAPTIGNLHGTAIPLRQVQINTNFDLDHDWTFARAVYDGGRMDRFDDNILLNVVKRKVTRAGKYAYAYLNRSQVAPYWAMAREYVLADRMFPTEFGGSFTAHLDLIAGTTNLTARLAEVDRPEGPVWGCDAPAGVVTYTVDSGGLPKPNGPFPCFTQFKTLADVLDPANVSWKYYAPAVDAADHSGGQWSEFDAISNVRFGPDWNNVASPETAVLDDARSGNLPAVAWVVPDYANSDHSGSNSDTGPSWAAAVVNAIGESPAWNSTAIVLLWDDSGGWYDDAPPPQLDFRGLAIRVPCVIVSPYARRHYVSHTLYEYGSILKFIEQSFGLPALGPTSLGYTDTRANSLADSFDFTKPPHKFEPFSAKYPASYFARRRPTLVPPDSE